LCSLCGWLLIDSGQE